MTFTKEPLIFKDATGKGKTPNCPQPKQDS